MMNKEALSLDRAVVSLARYQRKSRDELTGAGPLIMLRNEREK